MDWAKNREIRGNSAVREALLPRKLEESMWPSVTKSQSVLIQITSQVFPVRAGQLLCPCQEEQWTRKTGFQHIVHNSNHKNTPLRLHPVTHKPWSCTDWRLTGPRDSNRDINSILGFQFSSLTQLWPTLCNPMNCSTLGLPVHHQLPEFTQTHVHWVGDAIQPSHPLSSPFLPALNLSSIRVFSNDSALHIRWPKYWSFSFSISPSKEHPGLISFRSPYSPRDSQESSPTPQFKSITSLAFNFIHSPNLTSIHDHWKNHSLD